MTWNLPPAFTTTLESVLAGLQQPAPAPAAPPVPAPVPPAPAMPSDGVVLTPPKPKPPKPAPTVKTPTRPPSASSVGGRIDTKLPGQYIKDPAFANDGKPIGGQRYMVYGNLSQFALKGFTMGKNGPDFAKADVPIKIAGLSDKLDGRWAPQVVVQGDTVRLLYCAGKMRGGIDWPSYRMHVAELPLKDFEAQAKKGGPVTFKEKGALFQDQKTFGGAGTAFGMIDPQLSTGPDGRAWMTYTVVEHGIPGKRSHQEFVRIREVDPKNPARAIGPDRPLVDGFAGAPHYGVVEAQEIVTIGKKTFLFVSSRAGDKDQRVLAAEIPPGGPAGPVPFEAFKPVLMPGGQAWQGAAVGSTGTAVIDGQAYMIHQGMDKNHRFTLGWKRLDLG